MPFQKVILSEEACPRCNGDAQRRLEERRGLLFIYIVCKWCRYRKFVGSTTREIVDLYEKLNYYQEKADNARNSKERSIFLIRLDRIKERIRKAELNL